MLSLHMYVLLMGYFNAGIAGDTSKDKGTLYLMTMSKYCGNITRFVSFVLTIFGCL